MHYIYATFLFLISALSAHATQTAPTVTADEFSAKIAALETKNSARIGVAVVTQQGKLLLYYRAEQRFAMCSTFKALLGAAVLSRVDAQQESLDRVIRYKASDLLDYAPITKQNIKLAQMTVAQLNEASIQYSDNTAANLLLDAIGGPAALTAYLRAIGDTTTRLDRNEPSLNSNLPDDVRDTSTPSAMALTLHKLVLGDSLSLASKEQLKAWLYGNTTGEEKLRAGFNKSWMIGDKTGTCANGASNDIALVIPRGMPPFVIAVFSTGTNASTEVKNAQLAEVARIVAQGLHSKLSITP